MPDEDAPSIVHVPVSPETMTSVTAECVKGIPGWKWQECDNYAEISYKIGDGALWECRVCKRRRFVDYINPENAR